MLLSQLKLTLQVTQKNTNTTNKCCTELLMVLPAHSIQTARMPSQLLFILVLVFSSTRILLTPATLSSLIFQSTILLQAPIMYMHSVTSHICTLSSLCWLTPLTMRNTFRLLQEVLVHWSNRSQLTWTAFPKAKLAETVMMLVSVELQSSPSLWIPNSERINSN